MSDSDWFFCALAVGAIVINALPGNLDPRDPN